MRQNSNIGYLLRIAFIFSGTAIALCYICIAQHWTPYQYGSPAYYSFLQTLNQLYDTAGFIFFAASLLEVWFDTLDRRVSGVVLLIFMVREYTRLGPDDRTFLLMLVIASGILFYIISMMTRRSPSTRSTPAPVVGTTPPDSSRLHVSNNEFPPAPEFSQPAAELAKANRIAGFRARGDLLPTNLSRQQKRDKALRPNTNKEV